MSILDMIGMNKVSKRCELLAVENVRNELLRYSDTTIVPKKWRGVFHLKNTKAHDDFACMESSDYDPETRTMYLQPGCSGAFMFRGGAGLLMLFIARFVNLTYVMNVDSESFTARIFGIHIPSFFIKATMEDLSWDPVSGVRRIRRRNIFLNRVNMFEYTLVQYTDPRCVELTKLLEEFTDEYEYHTSHSYFIITDIFWMLLDYKTYIWWFKRFQLFVMMWYHTNEFWKTVFTPFTYVIGICDLWLLISYGGDRRRYFRDIRRVCGGDSFPYGYGIMRCGYSEVNTAINSSSNIKVKCIGTSPVCIPEAFSENALIFVSGDAHTKSRGVFEKMFMKSRKVDGFILPDVVRERMYERLFNSRVTKTDVVEFVTRYILVGLLKIPESQISDEDMAKILEYESLRLFVFMPRWIHRLCFNKLLKRIENVRTAISEIITKSPLLDDDEMKHELSSLTDVLLFAGVVGTSHLVYSCIHRAQVAPDSLSEYIIKNVSSNMSNSADPADAALRGESRMDVKDSNWKLMLDYIIECARLDPPVTSVNTCVSRESRDVFECMGEDVSPPIGFPVGWCISESHFDNRVFENPSDFDSTRGRDVQSKILAWNGSGLRKCMGKELSQVICGGVMVEYVRRMVVVCGSSEGGRIRIGTDRLVPVRFYEKRLYRVYSWLMKHIYVMQKRRFDSMTTMCFKKEPLCKRYEDFERIVIPGDFYDADNPRKHDAVDVNSYIHVRNMVSLFISDAGFKERLMSNIEYWLRQRVIGCDRGRKMDDRSKFGSISEFYECTSFFEKELSMVRECPLGDTRDLRSLYVFFMEHMGLVTLEQVDSGVMYMSHTDTHFNSGIKIRDGFQLLNYRVVIDTAKQRVDSLRYNGVDYVIDSEVAWGTSREMVAYAVNGVLTAAITRIVLYEHFFYLHKFIAESHTLAMSYAFSEKHPLFRLLHPHSFNVLNQNISASYALFDSKPGKADGMLSNFFAITADSYEKVMMKCYAKYNANEFCERVTNVPNSSLSEDSRRFYEVFERYVGSFIDIIYEDDAEIKCDIECVKFYRILVEMVPGMPNELTRRSLKDSITAFMFGSSVIHEIVGTSLLGHYQNPFRVSTALTSTEGVVSRVCNQSYSSQAVISNVAVFATGLHSVSLRNTFDDDMFHNISVNDSICERLKATRMSIWKDFENVNEEIIRINRSREVKQNIVGMSTLEYSIAT